MNKPLDRNDVVSIVNSILSQNQFSVAKTSSHQHNGIDSTHIQYGDIINNPRNFCVATTTSGTTPVNVFGSGGAQFNMTVTGVFLVSRDTTAGNVSVYNSSATVATIAKGTTSGAMVGAVSLSNTTYSRNNSFKVSSDSAGNATVFVTYSL